MVDKLKQYSKGILGKLFGWKEGQLPGTDGSLGELEEYAKRLQELERKAKSVFESTRTPMERFQSRVKDLREMLEKGFIDEETFKRAMEMAKKELDGMKQAVRDIVSPGAAIAGSREAYTAVVQHRLQGGREKIERDSLKEAIEQTKRLYAIEGYLAEWVRGTQRVKL